MNETEEIAKINNRIKILGIKKNHVAKQCEVSRVYLSYILNGKRNLTQEMKTKLYAYLGL